MNVRILLFTGKGGVGKTTCAAATALKAAQQGKETLLMSSDPAHSLGDALDRELGPEPTQVAPHLHAQEVDLYYSMRKHWGNIRQLLLTVFKWQGVDEVAAEELAALPGMEEASALLWLDQFYSSGTFETIIVDSAPTGETLTFLTLPQVTRWWLSKAFPFQNTALKSLGFGLRKTTGIPLDKGYDELERLFERLEAIQEVLADPEISSARLVMNPERMVIQETRRAYSYLQLYGYNVDAALVNRVLPDTEHDSILQPYIDAQAHYLEEIEQTFAPLPILRVPHMGREVFGLDLLEEIGDALYAERDPTAVFHDEPTYRLTHEDDTYVLHVRLPFQNTADVTATQYGDRLVIQVANQRRHYMLPSFLAYYQLTETRYEAGWLRARFAD